MSTNVPSVTLNKGVEMPILGFGVYQIPPEETEQAVATALEVGYRLIDTAASYQSEEAVGRAVRRSGIPRDELFITTKLWIQNPGEAKAKAAFEGSLERLGLDHVDLYLIHQPLGDYYSFWRAMEQLHAEGLARAIGVANFYPDRLVDLIEHNEVTPAVDQIETNPFFQRQSDLELMRSHGVQLESWGGFAEARNNLFTEPTLAAIGDAHAKSVAQVVLRWLTQRGIVTIPKSVRRERMEQNLDVFDFTLTEDEMTRIASMDMGPRSSSTTATRPWSAGSTVGGTPDIRPAHEDCSWAVDWASPSAMTAARCGRPPAPSGRERSRNQSASVNSTRSNARRDGSPITVRPMSTYPADVLTDVAGALIAATG